MITETHAHFDEEAYDADREIVIREMFENGVDRLINSGADLESSVKSLELAHRYDGVYASVGFHPDSAGEFFEQREEFRRLIADEKCVAVGEIGLDYHWDKWPRELQREVFIAQWEDALEIGKPIVIHSRNAAEDTLETVREMAERIKNRGLQLKADMHCYSYSAEQAEEYLRLGFFFGIGGVLTYSSAKKLIKVVERLPIDRILLETDSPFLTPEPLKGQRNRSDNLHYVAEKIAQIKGLTTEEVYRATTENAQRLFGFK